MMGKIISLILLFSSVSYGFSITLQNDALSNFNDLGSIRAPINMCAEILPQLNNQKTSGNIASCQNVREGRFFGAAIFIPIKITYTVNNNEKILVSFQKDNTEDNFPEFNLGCPANGQLDPMSSLFGQSILIEQGKTDICELEIKIISNGVKKTYSNEFFINISQVL